MVNDYLRYIVVNRFFYYLSICGACYNEPSYYLKSAHKQKNIIDPLLGYDWREPGTFSLPLSNSTLSSPYRAIFGIEAKGLALSKGFFDTNAIEAIVVNERFENIYFEYLEIGYYSIDDWQSKDFSAVLESVKRNTLSDNPKRLKMGLSEQKVIGWLYEPIIDRHANSVIFVVEGEDLDGPFVNFIAFKMGRYGVEKITWVTDMKSYIQFGSELNLMLRSFDFDPGFRYVDHTSGDY